MVILFILITIAVGALLLVSIINQVQRRQRKRRIQLRQHRLRINLLEEIVDCLNVTLPNGQINQHVNNELLELLNTALELEGGESPYIESAIQQAQARDNELANPRGRRITSFVRESDLQIAQTQQQLASAAQILRTLNLEGKIAPEEMVVFVSELTWAELMVSVQSMVSHGQKASGRGEMFTAQAYFKKAQHQLIESSHNDPRRMRMIRELGEMIAGTRQKMSGDLA